MSAFDKPNAAFQKDLAAVNRWHYNQIGKRLGQHQSISNVFINLERDNTLSTLSLSKMRRLKVFAVEYWIFRISQISGSDFPSFKCFAISNSLVERFSKGLFILVATVESDNNSAMRSLMYFLPSRILLIAIAISSFDAVLRRYPLAPNCRQRTP